MSLPSALRLLAGVLGWAVLGAAGADPAPPNTASPGPGAFHEVMATAQTVRQLRAGGYVLYLRHGATDNSRADAWPVVDYADCGSQRVLSEAGRQMAVRVGAALRQAAVPVSEIRVSPLCRTRETLELALGRDQPYVVDEALRYMGNLTSQEKKPILAQTRRLLSAPVAAGGNRLLVAHGPNLADLIGYFPQEATLVVFRPRGDAGFDYVASIPSPRWPELLRAVQQR